MPGEPALSAVGALARDGDPERFLAALFAPPAKRERLFALIALNLELAKIPATVSEPLLGEIRLTWWRDAVERIFETGEGSGHEVTTALAAAHRDAPLPRAPLDEMIAARAFALEPGSAPDALDAFLKGTGGALSSAQVRALGGNEAAGVVAALAGRAEGAGRLIAALPAVIASGETPLPGAERVDMNALREGEAPPAFREAVAALATDGLENLAAARSRRRDIPRAAMAPLLSVREAERTLRAAVLSGYDPFRPDPGVSPARARASLLARALRGRF